MKYYPIQLMDHEFCLLPAANARQVLKHKKFKTIKLNEKNYSILVRIKDLFEIRNSIDMYVLDDDGTELNSSDIQNIMTSENICCE